MPGLDDLSVEDLQAIQAKKWDSVSGPGLQAYQQYRQSKKQATAQAQNPQHLPDAADKSAQGNKPGAQSVSIQAQGQRDTTQKLKDLVGMGGGPQKPWNYEDLSGKDKSDYEQYKDQGPSTLVQTAALMANPEGKMAQIGFNGGVGALTRLLQPDPTLGSVAGAGLAGMGGTALLQGASKALTSGANVAMKRAMGITGALSKKAPENVGNQLVGQGLFGTRGMMREQVPQRMAEAEQGVQDLAQNLKGEMPGDSIADLVRQQSKSGGPGGAAMTPAGEAGNKTVEDIANYYQGKSYNGPALLALKREADNQARNASGLVPDTYKADAYNATGDAARRGLAYLSGGEIPQALKDEQALIYAQKGLDQAKTIYKNPFSLTDLMAALGVGTATHSPTMGLVTAAASKAIQSPLIQSGFAQGAQKVGVPLANAAAEYEPQGQAILQSLFSNQNSNQR